MSVGFWMMKPEAIYPGGREAAAWLCSHAPYTADTEGTTSIDVNEDTIAEMAASAKAVEKAMSKARVKDVQLGPYDKVSLAEHRRLTKILPPLLEEMRARCLKETGHDWFDLVISW